MTGLIQYFGERLSEPSTWRGIVAMLTAAGVVLNPEQVNAIIAGGIGLIGIIGAFTQDSGSSDV